MLFLTLDEVVEIHAQNIEEFGGTHGLRDQGALESALMAPEQRAYYEEADLAVCAATYAYHLSQAHAFIDGNKRIAAAAAEIFLKINQARLALTNEEIVALFLAIASGQQSRAQVEELFLQRLILLATERL